MSYEIVVDETETHRVKLVLDDDSSDMNPRTNFDGIVTGVVTIPTSRYAEIQDPTGTLDDAWYRLVGARPYYEGRYAPRDAVAIFERYVRLLGGVSEYDSPHDGPPAIWYVLPEYMESVGFRPEDITEEKMREALEGERKEYRAWAEGDVWGIVVERKVTWQRVGSDDGPFAGIRRAHMDTWEEVESVWGYIGQEYAEEEARAQALYYKYPDHTFTQVEGYKTLVDVHDGEGAWVARLTFTDAAKQYGHRGITMTPKEV